MPLNLHVKDNEITIPFLLIWLEMVRNISSLYQGFIAQCWLMGTCQIQKHCDWKRFLGMDFWLRKAEWVAGEWWALRAVTLPQNVPGLRPAQGFPSPSCYPDDQITLAGALTWWMLHCLYKWSSSSSREPKKKPVVSRKRAWTWASCTEMSACMCTF